MRDLFADGDPKRSEPQSMDDELLSGLDPDQRIAATHKDGPVVVFAGAGSGKTRIITHRIAWLIKEGVPPWQILAVTFTNKAAQEMKSRVEALTPYASRSLITTFHSACARWLREFAPELGFTSDFTIYDDNDANTALKTVLSEMSIQLEDKKLVSEYRIAINRLKTNAILPGDEALSRDDSGLMPVAGAQVYARYQEYLATNNAMDFGDLLLNVLLLLRRNVMVRETLTRRYRYILVDEYQDTNRTQFELLKRLAEPHKNLFVVGDDDQSIYSWRGALPSNIIDFDKIYPDAVKVTMAHNYRCTGHIVSAASAMITNNKTRVDKEPYTKNPAGHQLEYRHETDNEMESWWVVDKIRREQSEFPLRDVAVFYRTNSQSRLLEDALRRHNLPYRIYGTVRFYDRVEIKDLMAWFRVAVNPRDDISMKRIINTPPRGLGDKAIATIEAEALQRGISIREAIQQMAEANYPKLGGKLRELEQLIDSLQHALVDGAVEDALQTVIDDTAYIDYIRKKYPDQAIDKVENIQELGAALADFASANPEASIAEWLQQVTLVSSEADNGVGITLMTLHMAKGLEFRRVYLVGLEEGLLPHKNSLEDEMAVEEERRLLYVGITRAKEKLTLTSALRRRTFNTWAANRPSRFLSEIPSKHFAADAMLDSLETPQPHAGRPADAGSYSYEYDDDDSEDPPTTGSRVNHPTYGRGVIESLSHEAGISKAVVRFGDFGLRKVMIRHCTVLKH